MSNIRAYENYTSAQGAQAKKTMVRKSLRGVVKSVIEPIWQNEFGKSHWFIIKDFCTLPIMVKKVNDQKEEYLEEMDFNFCVLSFENCQKEHYLCINKSLELVFLENGLAEYTESTKEITYNIDNMLNKKIFGFVFCDTNGKSKKLFSTLTSLESYVQYLNDQSEKELEVESLPEEK